MKNQFKLRSSLIKGFFWRLISVFDTFLIVLIFSSLWGDFDFQLAFLFGGVEFILKWLVYVVHDRIWLKVSNGYFLNNRYLLLKTVSWRITGSICTLLLGFILIEENKLMLSATITSVEFITKSILYFIFEKLWLRKILISKN